MRILSTMLCLVGLFALSASSLRAEEHTHEHGEHHDHPSVMNAVCVVTPTTGNKCQGTIRFETQQDGTVKVTASISGLVPNQKHAFHVHEFGDLTDMTGASAGGHYNPEGHDHGLPGTKDRHAGDMGNLSANAEGKAEFTETFDNITIMGKNAIIGRSIIIHEKADDGGQPTGNAGARIGVGVIGVAMPAMK